jgi:homoserine O-acetyltransferase
MNLLRFVPRLCLVLLASLTAVAQDQQFAKLGDFKLESGEVIRDCRVGYRTFGVLNSDKSNIVVFPTWASGTTEQLKGNIGPGRVVNSEKFFVVAVDALGNGGFLVTIQQYTATSHELSEIYAARLC